MSELNILEGPEGQIFHEDIAGVGDGQTTPPTSPSGVSPEMGDPPAHPSNGPVQMSGDKGDVKGGETPPPTPIQDPTGTAGETPPEETRRPGPQPK